MTHFEIPLSLWIKANPDIEPTKYRIYGTNDIPHIDGTFMRFEYRNTNSLYPSHVVIYTRIGPFRSEIGDSFILLPLEMIKEKETIRNDKIDIIL